VVLAPHTLIHEWDLITCGNKGIRRQIRGSPVPIWIIFFAVFSHNLPFVALTVDFRGRPDFAHPQDKAGFRRQSGKLF
jgi:hypothetical protein